MVYGIENFNKHTHIDGCVMIIYNVSTTVI